MTTAALETTPIADLSDDQLMLALNAGHVEAGLAALEGRYGVRVHNRIRSLVRDRHLAEDLTQEVFAKVFFKSHHYLPGSDFRAWLFRIARNQALSALRARRKAPQPLGNLNTGDEGSSSSALERLSGEYEDHSPQEREFMALFSCAVDQLPKAYRDVFRLCVQQGKQYQEAASQLGIPTGTVAIRIMRARKRLFDQLSHHMGRIRRPPACVQ